jgi:hypothetical protein
MVDPQRVGDVDFGSVFDGIDPRLNSIGCIGPVINSNSVSNYLRVANVVTSSRLAPNPMTLVLTPITAPKSIRPSQ